VKDKLGADSQRRIETNRCALISKLEASRDYRTLRASPISVRRVCGALTLRKHQLEMRGVIYRENWRLCAADYYMRTTFKSRRRDSARKMPCAAAGATRTVELLGGRQRRVSVCDGKTA